MRSNQFASTVQIVAIVAAAPEKARASDDIASHLGSNPAFLRRDVHSAVVHTLRKDEAT